MRSANVSASVDVVTFKGLVRSYTPKSPPAPPGPAPPPAGKEYLWGVSGATPPGGWTVPAVGTKGPIKHTSGYCINGQTKRGTEFELTQCSGAAIQDFVLETNGNLHMAGGGNYCFAMQDFEGPAVVSWECNTGTNEEMVFDSTASSICDKVSQ